MKKVYYYLTTIGKIGIAEEEGWVTNVILGEEKFQEVCIEEETETLQQAIKELREYIEGKRKIFDIPLKPQGTPFRRKVWEALSNIPYGETRSYKDIAQAIGSEKAYRAVGTANNKNPIPIFIPCHRVIGADGQLVGYRGGIEMKMKLLALEKSTGKDDYVI